MVSAEKTQLHFFCTGAARLFCARPVAREHCDNVTDQFISELGGLYLFPYFRVTFDETLMYHVCSGVQ